jgi:hypothetical protein
MGDHVMKHLRRITLVFACLGCDQYTVANLQNLHVLTYHRNERRLPFASLLRHDVGLFSEEAGELSFSLLARCTLGDTVEDKHTFLSDCYCSLGAMRSVRFDEIDAEDGSVSQRTRTRILPHDGEVLSLQQHFLGVLRALSDGSFSYYPSSDFLKRGVRFKGAWNTASASRIILDPEFQVKKVWNKVAHLDRDWGQQFKKHFGLENVEAASSSSGLDIESADEDKEGALHPPVSLSSSPEWVAAGGSHSNSKKAKKRPSASHSSGTTHAI